MKTIKILGTGCPNCKRTEEIIEAVIAQLNLDFKIEKVEDIQEIMKYDVMSTPAIVVDEIVVLKGKVPSLSEAKELLENANTSCCSSNSGSSCCGGGHHEQGENCNSESEGKEETCCGGTESNCC
jgi:small redox-active disulfide protein 2